MRRFLYGKFTEPSDSFIERQYELYVKHYKGEDDINEGTEDDRIGPLEFDEWLYRYSDNVNEEWAWEIMPDYD